jgi:hypothetical protein
MNGVSVNWADCGALATFWLNRWDQLKLCRSARFSFRHPWLA